MIAYPIEAKLIPSKKLMKYLKIFLLEKHITSNTHKFEHKIYQNLFPSNNNVLHVQFLPTLNKKKQISLNNTDELICTV